MASKSAVVPEEVDTLPPIPAEDSTPLRPRTLAVRRDLWVDEAKWEKDIQRSWRPKRWDRLLLLGTLVVGVIAAVIAVTVVELGGGGGGGGGGSDTDVEGGTFFC